MSPPPGLGRGIPRFYKHIAPPGAKSETVNPFRPVGASCPSYKWRCVRVFTHYVLRITFSHAGPLRSFDV